MVSSIVECIGDRTSNNFRNGYANNSYLALDVVAFCLDRWRPTTSSIRCIFVAINFTTLFTRSLELEISGLRVAKDGHTVRYLGAWIGNSLKELTPWNPILDKVRSTLARWSRGSPSLKAQGMPTEIESALVKISTTWEREGEFPPLSAHHASRKW